ncbi:unnamed protein product [Pleuronectes platessa]|uniref:Uncharacterized protein n=1 Tax=Pleuronectes platessa TaxID=8262 RepID=A0A9N7VMR9_PLEPL|nr:unnamed protein product [Pleuronectes platessa]
MKQAKLHKSAKSICKMGNQSAPPPLLTPTGLNPPPRSLTVCASVTLVLSRPPTLTPEERVEAVFAEPYFYPNLLQPPRPRHHLHPSLGTSELSQLKLWVPLSSLPQPNPQVLGDCRGSLQPNTEPSLPP